MPQDVYPASEVRIIQDILAQLRRLRGAVAASVQEPIWEDDTFTISGSGDTAHTLSWIPYGINVALLNGLGLVEGTDYTADYTTGVVTLSTTLTAGDVLHVRYVTTGELKVFSTAPDVGEIVDTFNRPDTSGGPGTTSDGQAVWTNLFGDCDVVSDQFMAIALQAVFGGLFAAATIPGTANGTVQATLKGGMTTGIIFRCQDANNFWLFEQGNAGNSTLSKYVAGTRTDVTFVSGTAGNAVGDVYKVVFSGSSITCYHNGVSVMTATDTTLETATGVGLLGSVQFSSAWDDFSFLPG